MKKIVITSLVFVSIAFLYAFKSKKETPELKKNSKPNIVLIMADDMGFSDIGSYGSEIKTPNIDRLANEGTRLERCYNNAICAPSRASLLTGQYPHKAGIGFFNKDLGLPAYQGYLNKESLTLAEGMKLGGYSTYMCGKWHVGNKESQWPLQRGFDKFFGFIDGALSYFDTKPIMKGPPKSAWLFEGNKPYTIEKDDFYLTDELTTKAIAYLDEQPKSKPFFLYMAYNAPHWPLHAKEKDIERHRGLYDKGWDVLRENRLKNLKKIGLFPENQNADRDASIPEWESLTYDEKQYWVKKMEVYSAMVDNLDQNIGRLIKHLEEAGELDNTLIVFISDNGADDWDFSKHPFSVKRNSGSVGTSGSNESYTKYWAQVSNMPLRSYKSNPYEGGVSSPFVARWPEKIPQNTIQKGGVHVIDFLPTFLDIAGVSYPKEYNGITTNPLLGKSFITSIQNNKWNQERELFHEWSGNRAVWSGEWKLLSTYPKNEWELYNLKNDRVETKNLANEYPEVVKELEHAYNKWAKDNDVEPWSDEFARRTGFGPKH
ncbi:arylsulfatase [Thalassobellus suaedae]|uniref:Arylsulfatase n=1 Tax=Thalassobellus suaedae TaxID=3074124 RepID=A0ABY9Y415_9FLAO|nr:arylsulfatase [Flavobacteriaceae bacterium HL-DH10]